MIKQITTLLQKSQLKQTKFVTLCSQTIIYNFSSLPYNFEGLSPGLNQENSQKLRFFVQQTIGNDIQDGFAMAYSNLIQAIAQKDMDFLYQILEPKLYSTLKSSLLEYDSVEQFQQNVSWINNDNQAQSDSNSIQNNKYIIDFQGSETIDPYNSIVFGSLDFHHGVNFERSKNGNLSGQKQQMNMFNFASINFYGMGSQNFLTQAPTRPIVRLDTYFRSNLKLIVKDRNGNIIQGDTDAESQQIHKVRFETDPGDEPLSKTNLFQSFFQLQAMGGKNINKEQMFADLFLGKNYDWKIVDIDNSLNGNEFDQ